MAKQLQLGWPFPSGLPQGADWEFLRRAFGDLAKFLSWPFVGVQHVGPTAVGAGLNPITFTVIPNYDQSSLFRPTPDQIQVPRDFSHYLAVGVVGTLFDTAATGTTRVNWRLNGATNDFGVSEYSVAEAALRITVPILLPVTLGDNLTVSCASTGTADLEHATAYVFFIPLS